MKLFPIGLILLTLTAASPGAFALDPAMLNLVSPASSSLIGVDVTRVQASPFGQYITSTMTQQLGNIDKIASATGFDPRRDLQEILVASSGPVGAAGGTRGLIIARGVFDQQRLLGMAKVAGLVQTGYKGVTVLTPQQPTNDFEAAAFLAGYFVAGSRSEVEGAIDRSAGRSAAHTLASRAMLASTRYDAWLVSSTPSQLAGAAGANQGIPLNGVNSILAGVQFGSLVDIGVDAEARSAQDANSLADVVRLVTALGQSNQAAAQFGTLLNSLTISTEGNFVKASVKFPQADLERLLKNNSAPAPRARTRRVAAER